MNKILENEIDLLPESPGVYLMKNALDKVIYVGKAKILKNRVSQYFLRPQVGKVRRMVNEVDHFETIQTATEKEALLLEINLIRKYYPRYNILLKDGKSYPYIALKKDSEAPILKIKHNDTDKTYKYFGPFPNAGACYEVIDLLNRIYPLRKCSTLQKNVCLYYHIGSCLGPCIHKIEPSIYQKYMDEIESFLNGKDQTKIKEYERLMKEESSNLNFEKAAEYKKIIDSINHVIDHQVIDSSTEKVDRDVFGVSLRDGYLALAVLTYKKGRLLGKELFVVEEFDDFNEQMTELIVQYYSNNNHKIPNEIFVSNKEIVDILTISLNTKVFSPTS
ncbi:MAG: excinuclease ABC subunit C, partial [Bacilli bacterium]|nr:excinuclease ABC subunit C [Bacilli bacterium]